MDSMNGMGPFYSEFMTSLGT